MKQPLILDIKGNALDDGPGIRSVVFFKGCPLSCRWCHNPESKRFEREIAFDPDVCVSCGTCSEICPAQALSTNNPFFIDRDRCDRCMDCTRQCPSGALSQVGQPMTIPEILQAILKDKPFFETSGGGVTLSGGEPTTHMAFTAELLAALKQANIHTLMETCGHFDGRRFEEHLYPLLDAVYFDIKLIDPDAHKRYCGVSNDRILHNFKTLFQQHRNGGPAVLPRTPLIPGVTDTPENLQGIIAFLRDCGVEEAALLPYHPLWQTKNAKIGLLDRWGEEETMQHFMESNRVHHCRSMFIDAGIRV